MSNQKPHWEHATLTQFYMRKWMLSHIFMFEWACRPLLLCNLSFMHKKGDVISLAELSLILWIQGDIGGLRPELGWPSLGRFPCHLGPYSRTGRMVEHPKTKSLNLGLRPPLSPCRKRFFVLSWGANYLQTVLHNYRHLQSALLEAAAQDDILPTRMLSQVSNSACNTG